MRGEAELRLNEAEASLATTNEALETRRTRLATASAALADAEGMATDVEREPLDRPALEALAARLAGLTREREQAEAAQRDSVAELTHTLNESSARYAFLTTERARLATAVAGTESALSAADAAAATAQRDFIAHGQKRPQIRRIGKEIWRDPDDPDPEWEPEEPDPAKLEEWFLELERLRDARDAALATAQEARRQHNDLLEEQRRVEEEWGGLNGRLPGLRDELQEAERQLALLVDRAQEYRDARDAVTARLLGGVETDHPLALLPIRLETRFASTAGGFQLLVRIYPDDFHADSHEPELTADEKAWGSQFRQQVAAHPGLAADLELTRQRAWEQLAEQFGSRRAAWIAHCFDTTPEEEISERASVWTRAARTNVMPDRWVALAYPRDGGLPVVVWGGPIPESLDLGPSPRSDVDGNRETPPGVDEGMRWLIDFDAALGKGMALTIPLTGTQAAEGFERLVVVGVRSGLDADASAGRLASLLDAHHYTSGLALVPQNTPTNNTEETSSGYRPGDSGAGGDRGYQVERGPSLAVPGGDGAILARALGLDTSVFAHVLHADGRDQETAAAMNHALWPATGAWWFTQAVTGAAPSDGDGGRSVAWHNHFAGFVRARGPLPAFRVGNQPYGVLPITSLRRWQPPAPGASLSTPSEIGDALRAVMHAWDRARAHVLTLGIRGSGVEGGRPLPPGLQAEIASQKELLPIVLGQEATSCDYTLRQFADNARFASPSVGLARDPAQPGTDFALRPPEPNYLRLLRESTFEAIREERYPGWDARSAARPHPLLYLLLHRAALVALAPGAAAAGAAIFRNALEGLEQVPDLTLRALMAETLDACAYRFDAWVTSLATSRLEHLRADRSLRGLRLGSYGWVEDLRPEPGLQLAPTVSELEIEIQRHEAEEPEREIDRRAWAHWEWKRRELRQQLDDARQRASAPNESETLYTSPANQGFVQAPSLAHASTAAVLRSGYLSEKSAGGSGEALAIDLSSVRVQQAEWLLEGVRQGQSLGSLLGYRFERELHENRLDHHIDRFRTLAALREEDELAAAYRTFREAFQDEAAVAAEVSRLGAEAEAAEREIDTVENLIRDLQQRRTGYADEVGRIEGYAAEARTARNRAAQLYEEIQRLAREERPKTRITKLEDGERIRYAEPPEFDTWVQKREELDAQRREALDRAGQLEAQYQAETGALDAARKEVEAIDALLREAEERKRAQAEIKQQREDQAIAQEEDRKKLAENLAAARQRLSALLVQQWGEAQESLAARNVVDGLELYRRFRLGLQSGVWDGTTIPFGDPLSGFPPPDSPEREPHPEYKSLIERLRSLGESVDAVGDVVVAESVYQLVQGNLLRSGATLDAIARGETPPPELEVARTPRTGVALTHRVLVLIDPDIAQASASAWKTDVQSARAEAEPLLNGWVATLLPDPARVRCGAAYIDRKDGAVVRTTEVLLSSLGLSPLDVLFLAEGDEEAHMGELEQRLTYLLLDRYAQQRHASGTGPDPVDVDVQLTFARDADDETDWVTFAELLEVARTARKLVAGSRFLQPGDLIQPDAPAGTDVFEIDSDELRRRALSVEQILRQTHRLLLDVLQLGATIDQIQKALLSAAQFGIAGAIPRLPLDVDPETQEGAPHDEVLAALREQAVSVSKEIERRLRQIDTLEEGFARDDAAPEALRDHNLGRIAAAFGPDFRVLPRFVPRPGVAAEISKAFERDDAFLDNDPLAPVTWFQRAARVRDGVSRLDASLLYAEAIGGSGRLASLCVGQLPLDEADRWVALEHDASQPPIPGGRLSLVVYLPQGGEKPRFDGSIVGLLIDEWVEVVPGRNEITGLTFHFDQPDARAPQSILLAVTPEDRRSVWDLDTLATLLQETFDLAQMRAADPAALADAGLSLPPAIWFAEPGVTEPGQSNLARAATP